MTLKKDATQADVDKLKEQKGKVTELGADKAERSGAPSLRKYPDEDTAGTGATGTTGAATGTTGATSGSSAADTTGGH